VHFVGHSLGGILLAHLLGEYRAGPVGRTVLIGCPMLGSTSAAAMDRRGLGRLMGAAQAPLLNGGPAWPTNRPVARIAGVQPCGPGRLIGGLARPHDGTVALVDMRRPHGPLRLARSSHLGLLASQGVADGTARYLPSGTLPPLARHPRRKQA